MQIFFLPKFYCIVNMLTSIFAIKLLWDILKAISKITNREFISNNYETPPVILTSNAHENIHTLRVLLLFLLLVIVDLWMLVLPPLRF